MEDKKKLWKKVVRARREMLTTDKFSNLIYLAGVIQRRCRQIREIQKS